MKNIVVLFDLHGILDLSNPIIKQKLDNTFIILQPSCTLATQWASCCNLYHIAKKNKIALDIYFLNEEQEMYDVLALDTICHPYLASMPDLLKSPIVHFHHITWRSLTYSKRADYEYKIHLNKDLKPTQLHDSSTANSPSQHYPKFSHIVLDTIVNELRTSELLLERRFVLPMSVWFIIHTPIFFKYPNNPINGYHHFIIKTSSKALKTAVFAMHSHYQLSYQHLKKEFDKILGEKINRPHQFYAQHIHSEIPSLPSCQRDLDAPKFYKPTQDEHTVKSYLRQQKTTFTHNIANFEHEIDKWFKKQSLATHRQQPTSSLGEFLAYLGVKEPVSTLNGETLELILMDIKHKRNFLSAFSAELDFGRFIDSMPTWKQTAYEQIMPKWVRIPTKVLFFVNMVFMLILLIGVLLTATDHRNRIGLTNFKVLSFDTPYFQIGLTIIAISVMALSLIVWQFKRNRTKKAIKTALNGFAVIENNAIAHSKDIQVKYNQQLEALILGKNQNIILQLLSTYQQYKDQLTFIKKTLNTYQRYTKIDNPDDNISYDTPIIDTHGLFRPVGAIEFLMWGIQKGDTGTKIHNLTANELLKESDEFRLMLAGLFGIESVSYK